MNRLLVLIIAIVCISAASSCRTSSLSNKNVSYKYKPGSSQLSPMYAIYHRTADSSNLYMQLPLRNVLFKKEDQSGFTSRLYLTVKAFTDFTSKEINDSATFVFSPEYREDSTVLLFKNFPIKLKTQQGVLQIVLRDLNRNAVQESVMRFDKSKQAPQSFFVSDNSVSLPIFNNYVTSGQRLNIEANNKSGSLYLRYFGKEYPVAAPPFVMREETKFNYSADVSKLLNSDEKQNFTAPRKGVYHFQFDTLLMKGLTLFYFDDDYPRITNTSQLIEGLRYITSNKEYNQFKNASDKKEAVDNFWVEVSGSRERARRLIQEYYSRMEDANRFFTSYLEGWKTDRGMVFIVFGRPQTVYESNGKEYWEYSYAPGFGNLSFTFKKMSNPFSENDFELERQPFYESVWYMAVDRWRQGRVFLND